MDVLKIDKLNIVYNNHKKIYEDVSVEIPHSSFVSLTGVSGSGKTTFLKFILGEIKDASGLFIYDDQIIDESNKDSFIFNEVSYIDQEGHFFENMSIKDYFEFECQIHGVTFSKEEMIKCLEQVQLKNIVYQKSPKLLSTGERKRFLISVALMIKKNILLIDEPTASLDYHHKTILLDILQKLSHQGMTVIVTTHDEDVLEAAQFIYEIQDYKLIEKKSQNIVEKPIHKKIKIPQFINYVKYKSLKLKLLFIICICIGGASIGFISQNIATFILLNTTTQMSEVLEDTNLFLVKKLEPRYILENSNIFDYHPFSEEIDYISKDELTEIQNIPGVKNILPCIDVRKADQMVPFSLYQNNQFVKLIEPIATTSQTYQRYIYLSVYYPEEHILNNGDNMEGIYINDILYNMMETQVDSLSSMDQLSIGLDVLMIEDYERSMTEEKMLQMNPIINKKQITVPIDVHKILDATNVLDTRHQEEGCIYIPVDMFEAMYNDGKEYPTRQYQIICEAGKEEDIKMEIENMDNLYYASNLALSNHEYVQFFQKHNQTNQSLTFVISLILCLALFMLIYAYCQIRKKEISLLKREGIHQKTIKKYLSRDFLYMSIGWLILAIGWIGIYGFCFLSLMYMSISLSLYIVIAIIISLSVIGFVYMLSSLMIRKNIKDVS